MSPNRMFCTYILESKREKHVSGFQHVECGHLRMRGIPLDLVDYGPLMEDQVLLCLRGL